MTDDRFTSPLPTEWRRRLHQVHRYLVAHFPAAYATRLVVRRVGARHEAVARISQTGPGELRLTLDDRLCWYAALESLLHEWAHAMTWDGVEDHGPAWAGAYVALVQAFEEGGALEDSRAW